MSRMDRVKEAISSTLDKLRAQIEESHKNGRIPADYSLGFTNALIFADHHVNLRDNEPKFYDRTTSVGSLPKPVALQTDEDSEVQFMQDQIITQAAGVTAEFSKHKAPGPLEFTNGLFVALTALKKAQDELETYLNERATP